MFADLLDTTRDYWRKLDEVEAAYTRNELTLEEVNAKVHALMAELGEARRQALRDFWAVVQVFVQQQKDTLAGVVTIGVLAYLWLVFTSQA
jgi:hypothetical protein